MATRGPCAPEVPAGFNRPDGGMDESPEVGEALGAHHDELVKQQDQGSGTNPGGAKGLPRNIQDMGLVEVGGVTNAPGPKIEPKAAVDWRDQGAANTTWMARTSHRPAAGAPWWMVLLPMVLTAGSPVMVEHGHDRTSLEIAKVQKAAAIEVAEINRDAAIQAVKIANSERPPDQKKPVHHGRGKTKR